MVAPETIARILFLDIGCPRRGPAADPQVGVAAALARQDRPRRKDEVDDTGFEIDRRENPDINVRSASTWISPLSNTC